MREGGMNVTFNRFYREYKKSPTFDMTKDQFLLLMIRKVVDGNYGRWQVLRFYPGVRCYLHIDTLLAYFRQYTTRLERKK